MEIMSDYPAAYALVVGPKTWKNFLKICYRNFH